MQKERCAEVARIESLLEEEAEKTETRCGLCGGELFRLINTGYVLACVDCGAEWED